MKKLGLLGIVILIVMTAGCYGESLTLPNYIATVYIPMFDNLAQQQDLDIKATEAVTDEFLRDGKLQVVWNEAEADSVLRGTITGYRLTPVSWDVNNRIVQYIMNIECSIEFVDRITGATLVRDNVRGQTTFSLISSPPETEEEAIPRAAKELAIDILFLIMEGRQYHENDIRFGRNATDTAPVGGILPNNRGSSVGASGTTNR